MKNNLDYPFFNNQGENDQRIHINYTFSNCIKEYQGLVTYSDFISMTTRDAIPIEKIGKNPRIDKVVEAHHHLPPTTLTQLRYSSAPCGPI